MPAQAQSSDEIYGGGIDLMKIGGSGGTNIGFTRGGVEISRSNTTHDSEVDQNTAILKKRTVMNRMNLRFSFAQGVLEHVAYAWNIASSAIVSSSLQIIDSSDEEKAIYIEAPGPDSKTSKMDLYRCFAQGDSPFRWARDEDVNLPADFEIMLDATKNPSRFGDWWITA